MVIKLSKDKDCKGYVENETLTIGERIIRSISEIEGLSELIYLKKLDLYGNYIQEISGLENLTNLENQFNFLVFFTIFSVLSIISLGLWFGFCV